MAHPSVQTWLIAPQGGKIWIYAGKRQRLGKLGQAGVETMLIGIALGSTLEVMPYTGYPISQNLARTLFWISIGMLLFGVALVIIVLRMPI